MEIRAKSGINSTAVTDCARAVYKNTHINYKIMTRIYKTTANYEYDIILYVQGLVARDAIQFSLSAVCNRKIVFRLEITC